MHLYLDFETEDKHLGTLGSGWVHGQDFKVLGGSFKVNEGPVEWLDYHKDKEKIIDLVSNAKVLYAFNAQYDFGILMYMGIDLRPKTLIDVLLLAKLYDNSHLLYNLDYLAGKYLGSKKLNDELGLYVLRNNLYKEKGKIKELKETDGNLLKTSRYAKENLDELYELNPSLVTRYANLDVDLMYRLFELFYKELITWGSTWYDDWVYRLSCVLKQLLYSRQKGIRVDILRLKQLSANLTGREDQLLKELRHLTKDIAFPVPGALDSRFNPNSIKHLRLAVDYFNIPYETKKKTGNATLDKGWLRKNKDFHPFCFKLYEYRRLQKVRRDFVDKILDMQDLLPEPKKGKIYPEYRIFGAETGRFSCTSPNCQQIPDRDKELGPAIKSCFLPHSDAKLWCSMDYRQQEFRIFAHYCFATGVDPLIKLEYDKDPLKDYHNIVSEMLKIERAPAKTINLGSLYGMGQTKQTQALTQEGLTENEAKEMYDKYHSTFPAVKSMTRLCAKTLKERGYVRTLLGRRCRLERPWLDPETKELVTFEYQGISKIIQGSASDQIINVLVKLWEHNIIILGSVHDAIELSIKDPENEIPIIRKIMESSLSEMLSVPMKAKVEIGSSWGELKETDS